MPALSSHLARGSVQKPDSFIPNSAGGLRTIDVGYQRKVLVKEIRQSCLSRDQADSRVISMPSEGNVLLSESPRHFSPPATAKNEQRSELPSLKSMADDTYSHP